MMKKILNRLLLVAILAFGFNSCKSTSHELQVRKMDIVFDTLGRNDYTTIKNLNIETNIEYYKGRLDKKYTANLKKGGFNEKYTANLKKGGFNDLIIIRDEPKNSNFDPFYLPHLIIKQIRKAKKDYGVEFAMYELIQKYPDIDYFMNVRINKYRETQGNYTQEKIILTAVGIDLITDIDINKAVIKDKKVEPKKK